MKTITFLIRILLSPIVLALGMAVLTVGLPFLLMMYIGAFFFFIFNNFDEAKETVKIATQAICFPFAMAYGFIIGESII